MDFKLLTQILGRIGMCVGLALLACGAYAYSNQESFIEPFLYPALGCISAWLLSEYFYREYTESLDCRTCLAVVGLGWLVASIVGGLPFLFTTAIPSWHGAIFESVAGFTSTSMSTLSLEADHPKSLLLWRVLSSWLGGFASITVLLIASPLLGVSLIFGVKSDAISSPSEKGKLHLSEGGWKIGLLYAGFTFALIIILKNLGLAKFDSVILALSTISSSGFIPTGIATQILATPAIELTIALFMLLSAINYSLYLGLMGGGDFTTILETELKWFVGVLLGSMAMLAMGMDLSSIDYFLRETLHCGFVIASAMSSTGFALPHAQSLSPLLVALFTFVALIGGMSCSTSGGIKFVRLAVVVKQLARQLRRSVHPSAVLSIRVNNRSVSEESLNQVWAAVSAFCLTIGVATIILSSAGFSLSEALSLSFSATTNLGTAIAGQSFGGPHMVSGGCDFSAPLVHMVLSMCMLLGKVEFLALLVLFTRSFWRR